MYLQESFAEVYRSASKDERPVFKGLDFAGLTLTDAAFPAADFVDCSFVGARLIKVNCQGWVLSQCDGRPDMTDCDARFSAGLV